VESEEETIKTGGKGPQRSEANHDYLIEKIACPQSERGRIPIRNKISRNGSRPQQAAHRSGMF
jgi:hypothetical protein